jgi:hypothetical protein
MKQSAQHPAFRMIVDIILIVGVFTVPWFALVVAIITTCFLPRFYELLFVGIVIDVFFGMPHTTWHGMAYWATLIAVIFFFSIRFIKSRLR